MKGAEEAKGHRGVANGRRWRWRTARRGGGWRREAQRITEGVKPLNSAGVGVREWGEVRGGLTKRLCRGGSFDRSQEGDAFGFRWRVRVGCLPSPGRIPGCPSFGLASKAGHGGGYSRPGMENAEEVQEEEPDQQTL
jgi:hypothetical protein